MANKLMIECERKWRKLKGHELTMLVFNGDAFENGD